jgi:hypothetical protein
MTLSWIVAAIGSLELVSLVLVLVAMTVRRAGPSPLDLQPRTTPPRLASRRANEGERPRQGIAVSSPA